MRSTTKKMLTIIGEQYARILELEDSLRKAEEIINKNIRISKDKGKER